MSGISIATWNINSVRLRAPSVAAWVAEADPDVLCLQEIKCLSEQFPEEAFREMGFRHFHIRGQKGMHGVAIASKLPLEDLPDEDLCPRSEARHQRVSVAGFELHNFYIPAGGDEPDPEIASHTPGEVDALERIRLAGQFSDVARELIPMDEKIYTWWSYRAKDWKAANRGRRLDHIWVSPELHDQAVAGGREALRIWDHVRSWEKPSDHAPVVLTLQA